ncbi:hypothetical protein SLA2020_481340 [Shorea laevis]
MYEVKIVEEEWRSDLDWWLLKSDWKSDQEKEFEYSVSWNQNEDSELATDESCGGDDVSIDSEQSMKYMDFNSNLKHVTEKENCNQIEPGLDLEGKKVMGCLRKLGFKG